MTCCQARCCARLRVIRCTAIVQATFHCIAHSFRAPQTGTDYGPFLANEPSPMHTTSLVDACTRKLVADWRYLRENVSGRDGRVAAQQRRQQPPTMSAPRQPMHWSTLGACIVMGLTRLLLRVPPDGCCCHHASYCCRLASRWGVFWTTARCAGSCAALHLAAGLLLPLPLGAADGVVSSAPCWLCMLTGQGAGTRLHVAVTTRAAHTCR